MNTESKKLTNMTDTEKNYNLTTLKNKNTNSHYL